jgi:hypothetical protein
MRNKREGDYEKHYIGLNPSSEPFVRESALPAIPGRGKEMEFKTDRQTAKIMAAITKSRAPAALTNDPSHVQRLRLYSK